MDQTNLEVPMQPELEQRKIDRHAHGVASGVILILIGTFILLSRWLALDLGVYLLLLLGLGMLIWGMFSRSSGWIIAGSILTGIGTGVLVFNSPWQIASDYQPGIFLLCFALGWFLIPLLTRLFTPGTHWWPFIPGGIMAVVGCALLFARGALQADLVNVLQGALLILAGLYLVFHKSQAQKE
jgi:hypothetical protein